MSYEVVLSDVFKREAKRLIKKYPSLKDEIAQLASLLATDPKQGTPLGDDLYKIRLSIASKGKGRSGGARVITYVQVAETTVLLVTIYNKGERDTISDKEIRQLLKGMK